MWSLFSVSCGRLYFAFHKKQARISHFTFIVAFSWKSRPTHIFFVPLSAADYLLERDYVPPRDFSITWQSNNCRACGTSADDHPPWNLIQYHTLRRNEGHIVADFQTISRPRQMQLCSPKSAIMNRSSALLLCICTSITLMRDWDAAGSLFSHFSPACRWKMCNRLACGGGQFPLCAAGRVWENEKLARPALIQANYWELFPIFLVCFKEYCESLIAHANWLGARYFLTCCCFVWRSEVIIAFGSSKSWFVCKSGLWPECPFSQDRNEVFGFNCFLFFCQRTINLNVPIKCKKWMK